MTFSSLGLSESILEAVGSEGYTKPTPIQQQAIPVIMKGRDVMGAAKTGTGKTASFTLPILERLLTEPRARANQVHALILAPTRELAAQIGESVSSYGRHTGLRSVVVFGGVKINPQMMKLRQGADILIATPGRLLDLYSQNAVKFKYLKILVLDEADRILDMGFIHDIRKILSFLPAKRQNLMFSATFSKEIRQLAKGLVNCPVEISLNPGNTTVDSVKHWMCPVDAKKKSELLFNLMIDYSWKKTLVFTRTKHRANQLAKYLNGMGVITDAIHGNKSQGARIKALANFKSGTISVLVATDVAARGLDIEMLPQVVNFDLPNVPEDYVHRIGRTGRAGAKGEAISLVSADEVRQLSDIERLIKQVLNRELIDGFEPTHDVPVTSLSSRPPRQPSPNKRSTTQAGRRGSSSTTTRSGQRTNPGRSAASSGGQRGRRTDNESNGNGRSRSRSDSASSGGQRGRRTDNESNGNGRSRSRSDSTSSGGQRGRRTDNESNGNGRSRSRSDSASSGGQRGRRTDNESNGNGRSRSRSDSASSGGQRGRRTDNESNGNGRSRSRSDSASSGGQQGRRTDNESNGNGRSRSRSDSTSSGGQRGRRTDNESNGNGRSRSRSDSTSSGGQRGRRTDNESNGNGRSRSRSDSASSGGQRGRRTDNESNGNGRSRSRSDSASSGGQRGRRTDNESNGNGRSRSRSNSASSKY